MAPTARSSSTVSTSTTAKAVSCVPRTGALPNVRDSGSCVAAADYDRDGDLDLFVGSRVVPGRYPISPTSRLLRNDSKSGELKFTDATESDAVGLAQTGMVTSALWSDVDGDGDVDLLITHEWGPVKLYPERRWPARRRDQGGGARRATGVVERDQRLRRGSRRGHRLRRHQRWTEYKVPC